ncbi:MAG: hypothetical protein M1828_003086 [Chrysothrix sp. TS-e1954]|nr:MAG: hypothetical protein M1828_003086 [Chrysothrix sp. TS-e1954]
MASSVFFKFKSQKEPSRVAFDGTGISVFELKREIITLSRLGDGTDFDLSIYNQDTNEAYDDDTTLVPRSTSVIARRLPPPKPGQGRAARYVSGKMPLAARNSHRLEKSQPASTLPRISTPVTTAVSNGGAPQTEQQKIEAMMRAGSDQWELEKQRMADQTQFYRPGGLRKPKDVPNHPPPDTYKCHRCLKRGHWIQECPTNNDPAWDNQPRVKRSTGIPNSRLQKIDASALDAEDGLTDDPTQPVSVMLNADGERVIAVPDQASWDQYKAKAEASASRQDESAIGNKELQDRGLECPLDKRLFVEPMKTPCCGTTYCNDCIENALVNNDLLCPGCSKDLLIDNLVADEDINAKIKAYQGEKEAEKLKIKSESSQSAQANTLAKPAEAEATRGRSPSTTVANNTPGPSTPDQSKKRSAQDELPNNRVPTAPAAMQRSKSSNSNESNQPALPPNPNDPKFFEQMAKTFGGSNPAFSGAGQMDFGFPMSMGNMMNMTPQMMNPMMMGMPQMMNPMMMQQMGMGVNGMNGMGFNQQNGYGAGWNGNQQNNNMFPNKQGHGWGQQGYGPTEDDAYMRKPVNPGRHVRGPKRARPTDYREL